MRLNFLSVDVLYKTTAFYEPSSERSIRWDDADLSINWPIESSVPLISGKDAAAGRFRDADVF